MFSWLKIKRAISKLVDFIGNLSLGAWLLVQYICVTDPHLGESVNRFSMPLMGAIWICLILRSIFEDRDAKTSVSASDLSPRSSGITVVLLTGGAAMWFASKSDSNYGFVYMTLVLVGTIIIAAATWRFASKNAGAIGEARFEGSAKPK